MKNSTKALGLHDVVRVEWDAYDLLLDKIQVEVKSSSYLQAWEQPRPSRIEGPGPGVDVDTSILAELTVAECILAH